MAPQGEQRKVGATTVRRENKTEGGVKRVATGGVNPRKRNLNRTGVQKGRPRTQRQKSLIRTHRPVTEGGLPPWTFINTRPQHAAHLKGEGWGVGTSTDQQRDQGRWSYLQGGLKKKKGHCGRKEKGGVCSAGGAGDNQAPGATGCWTAGSRVGGEGTHDHPTEKKKT